MRQESDGQTEQESQDTTRVTIENVSDKERDSEGACAEDRLSHDDVEGLFEVANKGNRD